VTADRDVVRPLRRRRAWLQQWPIAIVLLGVVIAIGLIAADYFRRGSIVLAGSVLLAAFLRLLLPEREAGMLAVRSRAVDVAILGILGLGLAVLAFWVPAPS
jgi:hypothetical protein